MERYFLKNGKEVKIGDLITKTSKKTRNHDSYVEEITTISTIEVTPFNIDTLIEAEVLLTKKDIIISESMIFDRLSEKLGWAPEKVAKYLDKLKDIYPAAAFNIALKEVAIILDNQYSDHISKSPEIYVISTANGNIVKMDKSTIKNYKNFAAFRTHKDAEIAKELLKDFLKEMF